jgi:hypothetical protein
MITGLDWSSWSTVTDAKAMFSEREVVDVAFPRAWDGFRDDQEFDNRVSGVSYRKVLENAVTAHGSVLWAPYGFVGYSAKVGALDWSAQRGDVQAQNMWQMATAGGQTFQLPPMVDAEHNAWIDANGVRQVVPIHNIDAYCASFLVPFIERLSELLNRRPIFYSNPNFILNVLGALKYDKATPYSMFDKYPAIVECPLIIASYSKGTQPSYWEDVKLADGTIKKGVKNFWSKWLGWQDAGDVKDWPGISDVDHIRCQGTRAMWKAWAADASKPLPQEGAGEPQPEPEPQPQPGGVTLADVLAAVKAVEVKMATIQAQVGEIDADVTRVATHFK